MNDCEQYRYLISRLVDGELSGDEKGQLTEHLRSCEDCAAMYEVFSALSRTIGEDLEEPPEELCVNVMAKLRRDRIWKKNYIPLKKVLAAAACVAVILLAAGGILPKVLERSASTAVTDADLVGSGTADQSAYQGQYGVSGESKDSSFISSDSADTGTGKASKGAADTATTQNGSSTSPYSTGSGEFAIASGGSGAASATTAAPTPWPVATPKPTVAPTLQPVATPSPTYTPTQGLIITVRPSVAPTQEPVATVKPTAAPTQSSTAASSPTASATFESEATAKPTADPTEAAANVKAAEASDPAPSASVMPSLAKAPAAAQKSSAAADETIAEEEELLEAEESLMALDNEAVTNEALLDEGEAAPEVFVVSLVGSCDLSSPEKLQSNKNGLPMTIGEDMSYPFANTVDLFTHDELTLTALECSLGEANASDSAAPAAYGEILSKGGVDFVSTTEASSAQSDNKRSTATENALESAGIIPGAQGQSQIVTTANGLLIGIYTPGQTDKASATAAVEQLEKDGAEYIICMLRWPEDDGYSPSDTETKLAHDCILAGVDLVFGSGSHLVRPVESYEGGLIVYDLGSWISGKSAKPADPDTAVIRLTISRSDDAGVCLDSYELIPCCQSSDLEAAADVKPDFNDFCPSPYVKDSDEYERTLSKLEGKYTAAAETPKP